ncbi:MAG TPA: Type 1 glutamine amidotransferase-like domain-containing protein [Gammaproteobacteria bacterium]
MTLIAGHRGSRHFGTKPYLGRALALTGREDPRVLYIGAASDDDSTFGEALAALLVVAGAREVLWPKLTGQRRQVAAARKAIADVNLIFVGGGDVEAGMQALRDADLIAALTAAAARGVVFVGMSAGAIMLGERWIRWPREDAGDNEAETYECLGLARCSLDTHGEGDDWAEARAFVAVRAREQGRQARAYGVPSGGALVVAAGGTISACGRSVPVFVAGPHKEATIETTLFPDQ